MCITYARGLGCIVLACSWHFLLTRIWHTYNCDDTMSMGLDKTSQPGGMWCKSHWLLPVAVFRAGTRGLRKLKGGKIYIQNKDFSANVSRTVNPFTVGKSFVLGELSFARMPSRQYCLKVNKVHSCNWWPELVNCGQWQPWGVVTQHGMTQILGHSKLLQKLNAPHICRN